MKPAIDGRYRLGPARGNPLPLLSLPFLVPPGGDGGDEIRKAGAKPGDVPVAPLDEASRIQPWHPVRGSRRRAGEVELPAARAMLAGDVAECEHRPVAKPCVTPFGLAWARQLLVAGAIADEKRLSAASERFVADELVRQRVAGRSDRAGR